MKITKIVLLSFSLTVLTGCMGQMGLTKDLNKWNMEVTKDRWGREGIFLGLHLLGVSPIAALVDLVGINAIEFWTGTNPYTGKSPAVVDMAAAELENAGVKNVAQAKIRFDGNDTVKMEVIYNDGHEEMISAIRKENTFDFYQDGNLIGTVTKEELVAYSQQRKS
ncbi:conserved hypothetical protein [Bathymodiolus platifrons methanotrophic gill symbiont]|uniref:DUF3332 family protein n=1 Tax=Bathymodiolus platifrons methanotrophic gill symbiont TaxID=113268 RepID=UPI000B413C32|nr:DUF3332 family protein [Bathymodiolus platifrons methanotrophic gill symbiont]MCK5870913.1 DUF3332 family protein [Methyloprofundus sp.]TXL04177.1 DUF3332 domain-containing protein [Methylococcaceae bacterium CS1]TXL12109.1 DUF3332 domain-containing protein [Methylococcaceae bacterium CS2]TXL18167.1 DUF3332 domain-containing protein [Methylococcaceae bacterium HT3]GAW85260.1 conserved hypothetical protein [Bathymodiolus platifrons methanotrophic gill symbiont]